MAAALFYILSEEPDYCPMGVGLLFQAEDSSALCSVFTACVTPCVEDWRVIAPCLTERGGRTSAPFLH